MSYISVARIKKLIHTGKSLYSCTCPGDGLPSLPSTFNAYLLAPAGTPDRPPGDGELESLPASAVESSIQKQGNITAGRGRISISSATPPPSETEGFRGFWVFVDRTELLSSGSDEDLFLFDLLGFDCRDEASGRTDGKIRGYSETGAHGILDVELDGRRILVPLTEPHAHVDTRARLVVFSDLLSLDPDSEPNSGDASN